MSHVCPDGVSRFIRTQALASLQRFEWWRVRDSNPRSIAQLIYSQSPLATRETRRVQSDSASEPSRTGVLETLQERHIRLPNLSGKSQNLGQLAIIGGSFPLRRVPNGGKTGLHYSSEARHPPFSRLGMGTPPGIWAGASCGGTRNPASAGSPAGNPGCGKNASSPTI